MVSSHVDSSLFLLYTCIFILCSFYREISATLLDHQFDDGASFRIDFPGRIPRAEELLSKYTENILQPDEAVVLSSIDDEKYVCKLPQHHGQSSGHMVEYFGPSPKQLIKTFYDQRICTYRIDTYWTYEFCHGQYLLQYHEEKELRKVVRKEYYLGQYIAELDKTDGDGIDYISAPPMKKIDDQMVAYYAVKYVQGTLCDLNGKARHTTVYYVCDPDAKSQIQSFDEVATCEYELVIATPKLCTHPGFKYEKIKEQKIECYPVHADTPASPNALTLWEQEQKWHNRYMYSSADTKRKLVIPFLPKNIDLEAVLNDLKKKGGKKAPGSSSADDESSQQQARVNDDDKTIATEREPPADLSLAQNFLAGEECLYGGEGWWKYEYCHMKHVLQYHIDEADGTMVTKVILGRWDAQGHSEWISRRPHKFPMTAKGFKDTDKLSPIVQVNHFYSNGDFCEETGRRRTVEVRLKCKKTPGVSLNAVSLYLLEPKTCEYVLGVETAMICEALQAADGKGVLLKQ